MWLNYYHYDMVCMDGRVTALLQWIFKRDPAPPFGVQYLSSNSRGTHSAASDSDTQVERDEVFHVKETRVHETPANSPILPCPSYVLTEAGKSRHPQVERVLL